MYRKNPRFVMEMIKELHNLGYEKIRLYCYIKEGLGEWRHFIFAHDYLPSTEYNYPEPNVDADYALSGSKTPRDAALKFISINPEISLAGKGKDPFYRAWYSALLERCGPGSVMEMESAKGAIIRDRRGFHDIPYDESSIDTLGILCGRSMTNTLILDRLFEHRRIRLNRGALFDFELRPKPLGFNFDFVSGMLLGIAIGDSLGATTESMLPPNRCLRSEGNDSANYAPTSRTNMLMSPEDFLPTILRCRSGPCSSCLLIRGFILKMWPIDSPAAVGFTALDRRSRSFWST